MEAGFDSQMEFYKYIYIGILMVLAVRR